MFFYTDKTRKNRKPNKTAKSNIKKICYSCNKEGEAQTWKECEATQITCNFAGLEQGATYKIQVKVEDEAGNSTTTNQQEKITLD